MIEPIKPRPRATIADVARRAALSVATVDRVLNRRAPVKPETARRVLDAAAEIGFHAARLLARRVAEVRPKRRLGFLLQQRGSEFYRLLAAALAGSTRDRGSGDHTPVVEHMEDLTPGRVAESLLRMRDRCDALGVVAADHPKVNAAIETLAKAGVPVFTLLSDVTTEARAGYIGIDHRKAGRTAAWTVARRAAHDGDIAIVVGNHRYLGHELREISFRAYFREHAPQFRLLEPIASFEDRRFAHEATLDLLRRNPGLVGLYVAGGGIEGVIEALRERDDPSRVTVVASSLVSETRLALLDEFVDLVIAEPLDLLARTAVEAMLATLDGSARAEPRLLVPFDIWIAENL